MYVDPVFGMNVDAQSAQCSLDHESTTYYFCSTECLNQFSAKPQAVERLIQTGVQIGTVAQRQAFFEAHGVDVRLTVSVSRQSRSIW